MSFIVVAALVLPIIIASGFTFFTLATLNEKGFAPLVTAPLAFFWWLAVIATWTIHQRWGDDLLWLVVGPEVVLVLIVAFFFRNG